MRRARFLKTLALLAAFSAVGLTSLAHAQDYRVGNGDLMGSRSIPSGESELSKKKVEMSGLEVKWFAPTDRPVQGVPVVAGKDVYVGTADLVFGLGSLYAFDADTGAQQWQKALPGGVLASPLVTEDNERVYAGTLDGTLYALERKTGATIWSYKPQLTVFDSIWAGPIEISNMIIFAINPQDESQAFDPPGISALIAVEAKTGSEVWRFTPVPPAQQGDVGGAGIWGTSPSYSSSLDLIFVSTGQNTFSRNGDSPGSDAVFAIDAKTGQVRWENQVKEGDIWNFLDPFNPVDPRDTDIGEAPAVFKSKGQEYVGVGSKRGYFYIMDAETGDIQNGAGMDALGFKVGLDLFGGALPGPSLDGGFNLDSGYIDKGGSVTHFGILNDYSNGLQDVVDGVPPFTNYVCYVAFFGLFPECPGVDSGNLVLINQDGTAELGRYTNPGAPIFSPVHLDGMIFVHEAADFVMGENDKLLVLDVSDPTDPVLMATVELSDPANAAHTAFSLGGHVSVGNGRIYTGNGLFGFGPQQGLFSIGLVK